ncbi:MAG: diguanylate cyclase [Treponema sp.]|nr:diguanylate cyclase [Treponema sp.]
MAKKLFIACILFSFFPLFAKTVKVGYYRDSGNFMSGFSTGDERTGYAYEYIQTVAAYAGWECEYVYGEWDVLYPALLAGEIDILSDVSKTPEREGLLLYPDYAMGRETYYLYSNDKNAKISPGDFSTWKGKKIALNRDYYHYSLFMDWQKNKNLGCEYVVFSGDDEYYSKFENHEFDMLLEIDTVAEPNWNPIIRIGSSDFYLAVTKSRKDLLLELNAAMAEIFSMNPYYNNNLWLKYFTDATVAKNLSQREDDWLKAHPKINVGCMVDDLPFAAFNDEKNKVEGLVVEMLSHFSDIFSDGKVVFSYMFYEDTDLMFSDLQNGLIDMIVPMYRDLNYAEDSGFIVSEKFSAMSVGYATKNTRLPEQTDLIAVPKRLRMPFYIKRLYPKANVRFYKSYEDCVKAVLDGECDGAAFNTYKMQGIINKNKKFRALNILEFPTPCEISFVFSKKNRDLFSMVNKLIMLAPSDKIDANTDTYVMKVQAYTKKNFFMEYFLYVLGSALVLLALLVIIVIALRRVREYMFFDPLTHLRNRRSLNSIITKFIHNASEKNEEFSLILFDLDDFKYLNDTYGHDFGDQALVTAANLVKTVVRKQDRVFRWGGEEFLILFKGGLADAKMVAERVRRKIEKVTLTHDYELVHFTSTAGVASYQKGLSYIDLFRHVDINLYKGKNNGKNQVVADAINIRKR